MFSSTTSEILPLSNHEILGSELPDCTFLLTFDDGPTAKGGGTDQLAEWLRSQHVPATFFLLGNRVLQRVKATSTREVSALYAGFGIGSHGMEHRVSSSPALWQASYDETRITLQRIFPRPPANIPYRPPYALRSLAITQSVEADGGRVVLWNIDSQDWNAKLPHHRIKDRVMTLMLLWRRGIVLFHDTQPNARLALPDLFDLLKGSGILWAGLEVLDEEPRRHLP